MRRPRHRTLWLRMSIATDENTFAIHCWRGVWTIRVVRCSCRKFRSTPRITGAGMLAIAGKNDLASQRSVSMIAYSRPRVGKASECLDAAARTAFVALTRMAAQGVGAPSARLNFSNSHAQWHSSAEHASLAHMVMERAFFDLVVAERALLIVPDATLDRRTSPLTPPDGVAQSRFCAGAPIVLQDGQIAGALCVFDDRARQL